MSAILSDKELAAMTKIASLRNGAEVILRHESFGGIVVLAHWEGSLSPWVTWRLDGAGNAFWGHYFNDHGKAVEDYQKRVKELLDNGG